MALAQRNKERVLAGESKYEDVDAMIDAYVEFEGEQKSMSRQGARTRCCAFCSGARCCRRAVQT